nr:PREDICTED: probable LRR receptor-like serine/threonine-protein kinase At3g47570 isoform X2 [Daucus carota subsp. sativus]
MTIYTRATRYQNWINLNFISELVISKKRIMMPYVISEVVCVILISLLLSNCKFQALDGNATDRQSLLAFKKSIVQDPQNALGSWNDSLHFCQWEGVTCGRRHQRVTRIDITSRALSGSLSPYLANLTFLQILQINNNSLYGEIPPQLGNLFRLKALNLFLNNLEGTIPANISRCSNLQHLRVGRNNLVGKLPEELGALSKLQSLVIEENSFTGRIPPFLGNFTSLEIFYARRNHFSGGIPDTIGNMRKLSILGLAANNLSGMIPLSLYNISSLTQLSLDENELQGTLHPSIGSLSNCSNLQGLGVSDNKLKAVLPDSVGNLSTKINYLNLAGNQLYGRLPSSIGNLINLDTFGLDDNQFSGTIPISIGNLEKLQVVAFSQNKFSGVIPQSIGNLTLLTKLYMNMNRLEGNIPINLANCSRLLTLELSQNNFTGLIPKQLFSLSTLSITLNLSHNYIYGQLPSDVGNLVHLGSLDLSNNRLSGKIPASLGSCSSLEYLFLQNNMFQGSIPSSLSSLKGVMNIDLSLNNLSGEIPKFFEQLSVKYLNLSFNNLEGEVPTRGIFSNLSGVSVLGNSNICGGMSELHLQKCANGGSRKQERYIRVLIVLFSVIGILICATILMWFMFRHKRLGNLESGGPMVDSSHLRLSYADLHKATAGFSLENVVGSGSFGCVYKGVLDANRMTVAVKVLNLHSRESYKSFMNECEALRNTRHRNLVKIITTCSSVDFQGNEFRALVYEFMPNGSLEQWLYPSLQSQRQPRLTLAQKLNIAIDVSHAVDYLHNQCEKPILHCDLKPSNILLDNDMVAHVGDFGLAKILHPGIAEVTQSSSVGLRGTIGYAAPEYGLGSEVSKSGDVYSFGILLLEMITGKRPTDAMFNEGLDLHKFVSTALPDHLQHIISPTFHEDFEETIETTKISGENVVQECLLKVGTACSVESPQARMSITDVVSELNFIRQTITFH